MGHAIMSGIVPQLVAPSPPLVLGRLAEGSVVKLNESGSPVEFYVAKHDYESSLNGAGRTLLVRKNQYETQRQWNAASVNAYATSSIDAWLNGDYWAMLDEAVRTTAGATTFRYTPGNGSNSVSTLTRSCFLLSLTEFGFSASFANTEGEAIPVASLLKVASGAQWTRSAYTNNKVSAHKIFASHTASNDNVTTRLWFRPCITLPATTKFDEETLLFKGV